MKLREAVLAQGNDYGAQEKQVRDKGFELIHTTLETVPPWLQEPVSIILPSYNVASSLPKTLLALESQSYRNFEVVVVDDASREDLEMVVEQVPHSFDLHFIRNSANRDRSFARNTGLNLAQGTTILILDPDIVPSKHYLLNLAARQAVLENAILAGFKHHVDPTDDVLGDEYIAAGLIQPDYSKDWRWYRQYNPEITAPNFMGAKEERAREMWITTESDYFKRLGQGRIIGAWDVASLVLGQSICMKKADCMAAGGFAQEFTGWGHDDIAFSVRAIAKGQFVIPCPQSTGYHINHPPHSGSPEAKFQEFHDNLRRFLAYVEQEHSNITFPQHEIKKTRQYGNTYFYRGP